MPTSTRHILPVVIPAPGYDTDGLPDPLCRTFNGLGEVFSVSTAGRANAAEHIAKAADAISGHLDWGTTHEGIDFWMRVASRLRQIAAENRPRL